MPLVQITLARGRTPEQLAALGEAVDVEGWRPWRSYALMHLWNTLMPSTSKEN